MTDTLLLESGSVSYQYSQPRPGDDATATTVRRTGSLVVGDPKPDWMDPGRAVIKPWVEMKAPDGEWARFYLGEFITLAPTTDVTNTRTSYRYRLVDRIQRYARTKTTDYLTVKINSNIALVVRALLGQPGLAQNPFTTDGFESPFSETRFAFPLNTPDDTLDWDLTFPPNTSYLEIINTCLRSVGWDDLSIDAEGNNKTQPARWLKKPEWHYPENTPVVKAATVEPFTGEIPNRLVFKARRGPSLPEEGNGIHTVDNQSTGPFSVKGRGGAYVIEEVVVEAEDQAHLERLAFSIAEVRFRGGGNVVRLTAGLNPLHDDKDLVELVKSDLGFDEAAPFWVSGWRIDLDADVSRMATMALTLEAAVLSDTPFFGDYAKAEESLRLDKTTPVAPVPDAPDTPDDTPLMRDLAGTETLKTEPGSELVGLSKVPGV